MNKKIILENCNQLSLEQVLKFIQSDTEPISLKEFIEEDLDKDMVKKVELALCNSLDFNELITYLNTEKFSLKDLENAGLNYEKLKILQLQFCNTLEIGDLLNIIQSGKITIEMFENAGLNDNKLKALNKSVKPLIDKSVFLEDIQNKSAFEIRQEINKDLITFNDLEGLIKEDVLNALKYYYENTKEDAPFYEIKDLPPLKPNRTDLFFIGMPVAGKSTMLAGISYKANELGCLFTEASNIKGVKYQDKLIMDLEEKVLPLGTKKGSYNYIASTFSRDEKQDHPFNIIEVPGERYDKMYDEGQANDFLHFISNSKNKKIFVFVVDSNKKGKQSSIFTTIINLIYNEGILNRTLAIYIIVNKFDNLKNGDYKNNNNLEEVIAYDYLNNNYKNFLKTLEKNRVNSDNKYKIKILPFSIGKVVHGSILESFDEKYSRILIDHLIFDSFYIKVKN
jgi:GTP-binding protein EngB required for normal cell division